jgi:hypothetical protein
MDDKIREALDRTVVVRPPRQNLATFGTTNVSYFLVTELSELVNVVREGKVVAEKPRIVTPGYLINLEGFSDSARRFIELMAREHPREAAVFYRYKNDPRQMDIVSGPAQQIIDNINGRIDTAGDPLAAVIRGVEDLWDVSLIKFTYELTRRSVSGNLAELQSRGLLDMDSAGIPAEAKHHIEELFVRAAHDRSYAGELAGELRRWGLFERYQDRFFSLFK